MTDDQNMKNTSTPVSDDFNDAIQSSAGVTEDQLNLMAAITEAQKEAADNSDAILEEMNQTVKDYLADNK